MPNVLEEVKEGLVRRALALASRARRRTAGLYQRRRRRYLQLRHPREKDFS